MAATMTLDMHSDSFDWAHDAYIALNPNMATQASNAPVYAKPIMPCQFSIERHGQFTPPEDRSPTEPRRDSVIPQSSMPPAQLLGELPWPLEHQLQALQEFQPQEQSQSQQQTPPHRGTKRRRQAKPTPASQNEAPRAEQTPGPSTQVNPQPPKRKRGRPKAQPQSIEEFSEDGVLFPASTARQSHLEKNRVAAHKCRQRRKEYIDSLEARGREASHKNKTLKENVALLREEILELKNEVLRHAGCNFWAVDEYLARCAGDLLGMDGSPLTRQKKNPVTSLAFKPDDGFDAKARQELCTDSLPSHDTTDSSEIFDGFFDNIDDDMEDLNT